MLLVQKVAAAGSEQYNLFLCSVKRSESQQVRYLGGFGQPILHPIWQETQVVQIYVSTKVSKFLQWLAQHCWQCMHMWVRIQGWPAGARAL
jgi:hypothetical protein